MDKCVDSIQWQIKNCQNILNKGYINIQNTKLSWLNTFCLAFLKVSQNLHKCFGLLREQYSNEESDIVENIYLCLTQIVTCIRHMENTLIAEAQRGAPISPARQHFLDRIHWCLDRLRSCLKSIKEPNKHRTKLPDEKSFVELMDQALDSLSLYSSYKEESQNNKKEKPINVSEQLAQASFDSKEIRCIVDLILAHTLAFANVTLQQDKKALSALCQKVLRECIDFQAECSAGISPGASMNESNRRLTAISLENALHRLEDYINDALLRLVFTCFLDFNKFSIDKLRKVIRERVTDDTELDELIADFDVNVDRATQIGIFAISFAPSVKVKTVVRSCLASFESLDSCIIPSLQTKGASDIFAQLLEQHFNEEVSIFKISILEIIDSYAFASCFYELLTDSLNRNSKEYNRDSLEDIIKMAELVYENFKFPSNYKQIQESASRLELFQKFYLILQECQSVLQCTALQLGPQRVLKRFKILRSILRKLVDDINDKNTSGIEKQTQVSLKLDGLCDSQKIINSPGITPTNGSILYNKNTSVGSRRKALNVKEFLQVNHSKLSATSGSKPLTNESSINGEIVYTVKLPTKQFVNDCINFPPARSQRTCLRRKESLRTALFKKQKSCETAYNYSVNKNSSDSLQISEILDQLTDISSDLTKRTLNKTIISK